MIKTQIDTSLEYKGLIDLPDSKDVEVPEQDSLAIKDPPREKVLREPYLASSELVNSVNLAIALGRPLLLQGDPGCGKTQLAYAVAYELGLPLEISYIKSTSRAQDLLYTYDAVRRLYDAQLGEKGILDDRDNLLARDARNYIKLGPLGRAIARASFGRRSVVLIDEIDKADIDYPNDLLWELDRLEFRVEEASSLRYAVGNHPELRPIIFITHNEEKVLPSAFLRRCVFRYVEFPDNLKDIERILSLHKITNQPLRSKAVQVLDRLRKLDLRKKPGLSELIDWVGYMQAMNTSIDEIEQLPYSETLLKHHDDQLRAKQEFNRNV